MNKAIQIGYDDLFEKKCIYASKAGFKGISVNFTAFLDKSEYEWEKAVDDIGNILEKNNLKCVQSHPYYYDLRISSEETEERYEFAVKQAIIASGKLGAKWCAIHPRSSISSGFSVEKSLKDNQKYIMDYLEYAHKYDTGIASENLPIFLFAPVMPFYSSVYTDLCNLVDSIDDERLGICWDTGHAHMMHYNQWDAINYLGNRIKCTHIHNNSGRDDLHNPPDNGTIKWDKVMSAFKNIGYEGFYTLETHCMYPESDFMLEAFARYNYDSLVFLETFL